ncbi:hypothetical protein GCM10023063_31830 [Arthrobacter methylotrophus]
MDRSPYRVRKPQAINRGAHHEFVLCVHEGIGSGLDVHARLNQGPKVLRGNVFVVERHDVQAFGEREQGRQILIVANGSRCHGRDRRNVLAFSEDSEFKTKGGCGWCHHSCELAAAHYANYRKIHKVQPTEPVTGSLTLLPAGARAVRVSSVARIFGKLQGIRAKM